MRLVAISDIVEVALAGKRDVLEAMLAGPHAVVTDWYVNVRAGTPAALGTAIPDSSSNVVPAVLQKMAALPSPRMSGEARTKISEAHKQSNPEGWYDCLELLFAMYPPPAKNFALSFALYTDGKARSMPISSLLYDAIKTGRPEIIDLCVSMSPTEEGRSVRITDAFDPLCQSDQGADLLRFILDHPAIKLVADPRSPEVGLDRVALVSVQCGNEGMVRELAARGVDFKACLARGDSVWGFEANPLSEYDPRKKISKLTACCPILLSPTVEMLRLLESMGADLEVSAPEVLGGESALFFALRTESEEVLRYLVEERGFDVNIHNDEGATPLHYAVRAGSLSQVQYLLERGASVTARDHQGWTPIHGLFSSRESTSKAKLLLAHGADIFARNFAGESELGSIGEGKSVRFVAELLRSQPPAQSGGDPALDASNEVVADFLVAAVRKKQFEVAFEFMKTSAWDPAVVGHCGTTPAHAFVALEGAGAVQARKSQTIAQMLDIALSRGMDLEQRDESGNTVLMEAVAHRNIPAMLSLIDRGADCAVQTTAGRPLESLTRDAATKSALRAALTSKEIGEAVSGRADAIESSRPARASLEPGML